MEFKTKSNQVIKASTKAKTFLVSALVASALFAGTANAGAHDKDVTLAPGNGMSFVLGTKRATTYFQSAAGQCDVTVMVSEADPMVKATYVPASRMRIQLQPGNVTHLDSVDGKSLSFACDANAKTMTVRKEYLKLSSLTQ